MEEGTGDNLSFKIIGRLHRSLEELQQKHVKTLFNTNQFVLSCCSVTYTVHARSKSQQKEHLITKKTIHRSFIVRVSTIFSFCSLRSNFSTKQG